MQEPRTYYSTDSCPCQVRAFPHVECYRSGKVRAYDDDDHIVHGLRDGAHGYQLQDTAHEALFVPIRGAALTESPLPSALSRVVAGLREPTSVHTGTLSQREQEVLDLLSQRAADKKTIHHQGITERRVKEHVTSNLSKVDARSRAQSWLWQCAQPPLAGHVGTRYSTEGSKQDPSR